MLEAFRIAVKYMTPVIVLSDGYIANSAEPWRIPDVDALERTEVEYASIESASSSPTRATPKPWPAPGRSPARPASSTASAGSPRGRPGNVSYDADNHGR